MAEALAMILTLLVSGCMIFAPIILVLGIGYFWSRHEGKKWGTAAAQLGLVLEPFQAHHRQGWGRLFGAGQGPFFTQKMRGHRAGMSVEVGVRIVVTGSGKNRSTSYYTYTRVYFPKELGLGLNVRPRGMAARAFGALLGGATGLQLGDPEVDPHYTIHAVDPDVAQATLAAPYVREALAHLRGSVFKPIMQDASLRCEAHGKYFDAPALAIALDTAVDLARRVIAARQATGPTRVEHAVSTSWRGVASARNLALEIDKTRMHGRCEGVHVEVDTFVRQARRWTLFAVRFDRPLGVGLKLTREGGLSGLGKLFGMQDIKTGDVLFDARFIVKGEPEAEVRGMLTPDVRESLVALQSEATNLIVQDDRLVAEVAWLVADAATLESCIVTIARAGAALAQVASRDVGPYRR